MLPFVRSWKTSPHWYFFNSPVTGIKYAPLSLGYGKTLPWYWRGFKKSPSPTHPFFANGCAQKPIETNFTFNLVPGLRLSPVILCEFSCGAHANSNTPEEQFLFRTIYLSIVIYVYTRIISLTLVSFLQLRHQQDLSQALQLQCSLQQQNGHTNHENKTQSYMVIQGWSTMTEVLTLLHRNLVNHLCTVSLAQKPNTVIFLYTNLWPSHLCYLVELLPST